MRDLKAMLRTAMLGLASVSMAACTSTKSTPPPRSQPTCPAGPSAGSPALSTNYAITILQTGVKGGKPVLKPAPSPQDPNNTGSLLIQKGVCVDLNGDINLYSELTSSVTFDVTFDNGLSFTWPASGAESILVGKKNDNSDPADGTPWPWTTPPVSIVTELNFVVPVEDKSSRRRYRMIYVDPQSSGKHDIEPGIQNH